MTPRPLSILSYCAILMCIVSLCSCQKELDFDLEDIDPDAINSNIPGNGAEYYISFKANDSLIIYTTFTNGSFINLPGTPLNSCVIQAQVDISSPQNVLGLYINDTNAIVVNKEYTDLTIEGTSQGSITYFDGSGHQYSSVINANPNIKIILTEITAQYISGNFSGKADDLNTASSVNITEGVFKVRRN